MHSVYQALSPPQFKEKVYTYVAGCKEVNRTSATLCCKQQHISQSRLFNITIADTTAEIIESNYPYKHLQWLTYLEIQFFYHSVQPPTENLKVYMLIFKSS